MANKEKIKNLIDKLDSFEKRVYPSKVDTQFEEVNSKFDQFQKDHDLEPLNSSIEEIKSTISNTEAGLKQLIESKVQELSDMVSTVLEDSNSSNAKRELVLRQEISDLKGSLQSLEIPKDNTDALRAEIKKLSDKVVGQQTSFQSSLEENKRLIPSLEPINSTIEKIEQKIDEVRKDLTQRISNIGGGNMNRNITFSGSVLGRYTDINLVGASFTNNDTTKMADINLGFSTFAPISITGTVNGSNLVFTIPSGIVASSLQIFDGTQYQTQGTDYTVSGTTVTFIAGHAPTVALTAFGATSAVAAAAAQTNATILGWAYPQGQAFTSITRDSNEAIVSSPVIWPDGSTGTFTTDTFSTAFPGAIDAYHVTYIPVSGSAKTITQPLLTRDAAGAVTAQPALVIT